MADAVSELPSEVFAGVTGYTLVFGDLDRATELSGSTRPAPGDDDQYTDWLRGVSGLTGRDTRAIVAIQGPVMIAKQLGKAADFRSEIGWTFADVSWFADFLGEGTQNANTTVFGGTFDPGRLDVAMGPRKDGIWHYLDGKDLRCDLGQSTTVSTQGCPLRLAERDDRLIVSRETPPVQAWLRGDINGADSGLAAVARGLDAHDVYAAYVFAGSTTVEQHVLPEALKIVHLALEPFDVLGAGLAVVDGEPVGILVYHHSTAARATVNAALLTQYFVSGVTNRYVPITERFDAAHVSVDGELVTVTLSIAHQGPAGTFWESVLARDPFTTQPA
jgi:hypothetical protein